MGGTSGQTRKLWVVTLAGLVSGILLGVLYAWIINPVKSLDAPINQLRPDLHEAYLRMAIDSYSVNQDLLQAKARFDAVGDHRSAILAKIEANPGTQSVQSILAYAKGVQNPASGSGGTPEPVGEVTGAFRGTPGVVLALLSLGALILASVLIYYRNRAPGKASSTTQTNRERSRQVAPEIFIYLFKRLLSSLFLLFLFLTLVFFFTQKFLPGDFVSHAAMYLDAAQAKEMRASLGLDLPLTQRYILWLSNLIHGDLGYSFSVDGVGAPVMQVIYFTLPATLLVFGIGTALAFLTGSWLGRYTAWRGPGFLSGSITLGGILLYTAFPPWLVFVLIYLLGNRFRRFGLSTLVRMRESTPDEAQTMWLMLAGLAAATLLVILVSQFMRRLSRRSLPVWLSLLLIALAWIASWFLMGIAGAVRPILQAAAFPILAYTLLSAGDFLLLTRTTMLDTMYEDYIWTAHAKGLRSSQVRDRHAGRNAILPVVSRLVIGLPFLLAGMVMIEETLKWPGIGSALFYAVGMQNLTLMMGMFLVIGLLSIAVRLILDVLIVLLDPRIRYGVSS